MQIKFNLKILIIILLFVITNQIEVYAVLMLFAIIHECGHILAGLILGFKPKSFTILPFGATIGFKVTSDDYNKKIKNGNKLALKKLMIAFAGPITNIIITTIFLLMDIEFLGLKRELIVYSNILIAIFNLIPIYPLDGGRIIKNVIYICCGLKESYKYTNIISNIAIAVLTAISSIAILYLRNISILIILVYLWWLVVIENKRYKNKMEIYKLLNYKNIYEYKTYKETLTK